jgi:type IV pilus assembly protein PilA
MSAGGVGPSPSSPRQGMAVASLVLGILSIPSLGCLGVGSILGLTFGIIALVRANRSPALYSGKGLAIAGIVTSGVSVVLIPFGLGILAAIAIPSLLRARVSANESAAIGDIRTVISAQAAYQSANAGFYGGRLECLATPSLCIPGYPANGPTFLDSGLASLSPKSGYSRKFYVSSLLVGGGVEPTSRSSVASYAYVAAPIKVGQTGIRGFCGDASGVICYTAEGSAPRTRDGTCDLSSCRKLQ